MLATTALNSGGDPNQLASVFAIMPAGDKKKVEMLKQDVLAKAQSMAGVTPPLGFWDPAGFCTDVSEGKLCFYREVELKHGRVAMLAALGFLVGESFHPLFGGDVDVPSYIAFQQTPLETFWPIVVTAIAIPEIYSVYDFQEPGTINEFGVPARWEMKTDRLAGDQGFDPLGLRPQDPEEFKEMQTKDLLQKP
jgi:light-harvesting complex I chlorophyll a/b binding protein 4